MQDVDEFDLAFSFFKMQENSLPLIVANNSYSEEPT